MTERERFQFEHLLHAVIKEATHYSVRGDVESQAHRILDEMKAELQKYGTLGYHIDPSGKSWNVTSSGTSVAGDFGYPKITGSEPEER